MGDVYQRESRIVHGRVVMVMWEHDYDMGPPWKEHDGHGPVREGRGAHRRQDDKKEPGERPLNAPGRNETQFYYGWQEAMRAARKDGWGVDIDGFMHLTSKLRRVPTKGQVCEYAVERDFQWLSDWCNNAWHWCTIGVRDVETGVEQWLGGIESENETGYHEDVISDLADQMWDDVLKAILRGEVNEDEDAA